MGDRGAPLELLRDARRAWDELSLCTAVVAVCLDHGLTAVPEHGMTRPGACLRALAASAVLRDRLAETGPWLAAVALDAGEPLSVVAEAAGVSAGELAEEVRVWAQVEVSAGRLTPGQGERLVALARGEVPS